MSRNQPRAKKAPEHPTDKYARSHEAPPPGRDEPPDRMSDLNGEDIVEEASEDSFPTSDPPAYSRGAGKHTTDGDEDTSS